MTRVDTELALRRGIAAQDYRASRARAVDRPEALLCAVCQTELDVAAPAHDPTKECWQRPERRPSRDQRRAKKRGRYRFETPGSPLRRLSAHSHNYDDEITVGELDRRHAAWAAMQPLALWCGVCGKRYEGPAGRVARTLRSHMIVKHPKVKR